MLTWSCHSVLKNAQGNISQSRQYFRTSPYNSDPHPVPDGAALVVASFDSRACAAGLPVRFLDHRVLLAGRDITDPLDAEADEWDANGRPVGLSPLPARAGPRRATGFWDAFDQEQGPGEVFDGQ
jgi:hypothetical protein